MLLLLFSLLLNSLLLVELLISMSSKNVMVNLVALSLLLLLFCYVVVDVVALPDSRVVEKMSFTNGMVTLVALLLL